MNLDRKKINSILEYVLIIILFLIGIKKGGYYKQDSLIGICLIQIVSAIFFLLNTRDIKKNSIMSLFLLIFSISYFIPVVLNATTMSGAINIAIRIYSMYLVFCMVASSENKEKYIKSIVVFTIIFALLGMDEMTAKVLDKPLTSLGSGYLEDNAGKMSSVLQYANILGILATISIIYLISKLKSGEEIKSKLKLISINVLIMFLMITVFLTQSKMVILLTIISTILMSIKKNENINIVSSILSIIFAFITSVMVLKTNFLLCIILSLVLWGIYSYLRTMIKDNREKIRLDIKILILVIIMAVFSLNIIIESSLVTRITDYFRNFDSTNLRFVYYNDALKIITASPTNFIFGIGGNGFRTAFETVQTVEYISLEVHSFFMQVFLEAGILGLLSILAAIIYALKKGENNVYKFMLVILLVFSAFDVFLTYTFMLFVLGILLACCVKETKEIGNSWKILYSLVFVCVFSITFASSVAAVIQPTTVNDINNTLEEQQKVIDRCKVSLILDPYDLEYLNNYTVACRAYIDIAEIRNMLYGEDNTQKIYELAQTIENNVNNELKYEKSNKYALDDALFYTVNYLDYLVASKYADNVEEGYIYYLNYLMENLNRLKEEHPYNSLANELYDEYLEYIISEYQEVNMLLNSDKIKLALEAIK